MTDAAPPWILVKALICRTFGWTPEELDRQPADEVLQMWQVLATYDSFVAKRKVR